MEKIQLQQVLPHVFSDREFIDSDIWNKNVEFEKGNIYLIEAASGTGKSSLCNFIYGYRFDYKGEISFDGIDIKQKNTQQWTDTRVNSLSMLFQELRLFPELTALENVLLKNNLTSYKSKKEILSFFDVLGIGDKINSKVGRISFGQQQRVAFIRSLCQPCDFIFLDEPVSHLDDTNSRIMGELLMRETSSKGTGIIATSIGKQIKLDYTKTLNL